VPKAPVLTDITGVLNNIKTCLLEENNIITEWYAVL
jgi:hypothetical protein